MDLELVGVMLSVQVKLVSVYQKTTWAKTPDVTPDLIL